MMFAPRTMMVRAATCQQSMLSGVRCASSTREKGRSRDQLQNKTSRAEPSSSFKAEEIEHLWKLPYMADAEDVHSQAYLRAKMYRTKVPQEKLLEPLKKMPTTHEEFETALIERTKTDEFDPVTNAVVAPRLQEHYWNTLAPDMMALLYNPRSPLSNPEFLEKLDELKTKKLTSEFVAKVFNTPFNRLPTYPTGRLVTHKLSRDYGHPQRLSYTRRYRKGFFNPIDYTALPNGIRMKKHRNILKTPYSPLPSRIPQLSEIEVRCKNIDIIKRKDMSLVSMALVGAISGVRPENMYATYSEHANRIRKGALIGAKATITGEEMYNFIDRLVHCVLPRWEEFKGINPKTDTRGRVTMLLPAKAVAFFPDVESHFENIPKFIPIVVRFKFNSRAAHEVVPLISGFQIPVKPRFIPKVVPLRAARQFHELRRIAMFSRIIGIKKAAILQMRKMRRAQRRVRLSGQKKSRNQLVHVARNTKRRLRFSERAVLMRKQMFSSKSSSSSKQQQKKKK